MKAYSTCNQSADSQKTIKSSRDIPQSTPRKKDMSYIRKKIHTFLLVVAMTVATAATVACSDDDNFSANPRNLLTFSCDTVFMDTVFSKTPSSTKTFWVYNNSSSGIRCSKIRLEKGNQTGFRINVNGVFLGEKQGYQIIDEEIRRGDSLRVFVELTSPENGQQTPQEITDMLIFNHESGVEQKVALSAWSWDIKKLRRPVISRDTVIADRLLIDDTLRIEYGATMTLSAGTTLFMNANACIEVFGTLHSLGEPGKEVTIRGSRLDRMFDYLPYDGVSGQWKGIVFRNSSFGNILEYTDIHSACDALVCDSSSTDSEKLFISSSTIHNNKGYGLYAENCNISIENSLFSNALMDCIALAGGQTSINNCTIAQFYPFTANRGYALLFSNTTETATYNQSSMLVRNSIITGYSKDEYMEILADSTEADVRIEYSLLRKDTVKAEIDTLRFIGTIFENTEDTVSSGYKNFKMVDTELLRYDFHLKNVSLAIGKADKASALPLDRDALPRDENPDMGCYEAPAEEEKEAEGEDQGK